MLAIYYTRHPKNHQLLQIAKLIIKHFLFWPDFPVDKVVDAFSFKYSLLISLHGA